MRNRFLATNCYTATATATGGGGPIETLDFVRLPIPHLPPNHSLFSADILQFFDEIPAFGISLDIEKLPIDDALSIFLSDVLPHFVDAAGFEEPIVDSDKGKQEEKDPTACSNMGGDALISVQFEIPEMDISLPSSKSSIYSQIECFCNLSEVPEAELKTDLLNYELTPNDLAEIQQSLYSVSDISVEYLMEKKADFLEDADSAQGKNIEFPVFEADMESLGVLGRIMMDECFNFENIERKHSIQTDIAIDSNKKELLGPMESDWIKYLFHHSVTILCHEDTSFTLDLDFKRIIEMSHCQEDSSHHGNPDGYSIWSVDPFVFDEFMFLDLVPYHLYEVFSDLAKKIEAETCECMFGEAMNFRNFSQLITCHELTLMDDTFKSLPVPIFSDKGITSSLHTLVEELLAQLDWQSSSASDNLYLNWHFLGGDDCESAKYSSSWKMLYEIDTYNIDVLMNSSDSGKVIFGFILSEGHYSKSNAENCDVILNLSCNDISIFSCSDKANISSLKNHGVGERINDDILLKNGLKNIMVFGESMSGDLEFFLNPRNHVIGRENNTANKPVDNTVSQVLMSIDDSAAADATALVGQKWNVEMHTVHLSDNILLIVDYLWKNFLDILENDKELQIRNQYKASNDLTFPYLSMKNLRHILQERIATGTYVVPNNDDIMMMAMLCAIKQMGFYLCYYGIQAAYLYMDKLSTSLEWLKSRLRFLYNLIRDENQKVDKELSVIHPSISVVKEILETKFVHCNSKILIVSDQVFWWPLKRLLTSLKISCKEFEHPFSPPCQQHQCPGILGAITDIMLSSDCCLVPHEYVSPSFPFSKFSFILEYGGSSVSSRISSIFPKSDGLPTLYFLKVEVEESSTAKTLSHGVDLPKSPNPETKKDLDSTSTQKDCKTQLEELLNTIPVMGIHGNEPVEAVNEDEACNKMPVKSMESKQNLSCKSFGLNTVIIVNTQNFNEEMVISRRSTYQRILKMEQEGAQVIERDIGLPVDVIISSAVCLTWYDCRNIGKKASAPDEAFSCLPLCVESIAASILTSLSFAFSCSILAKLSRGVYLKMSESESLAESFLTEFPSINPLSAQAILSFDGVLSNFLELSNESKICALQKYQVPDESVNLLSVVSRYGEREDTKSGITDCSSTLSVPDSDNVQFKCASQRKKPNFTHRLYDVSEPPDDLFYMETQNLLPDDQRDFTKVSVSCNSWLSGSAEITKSAQFSLSCNDSLPYHTQDIDADMMKPINKSSLHDFPTAKSLQIADERERRWMPLIDRDCGPRWRSDTKLKKNISRQNMKVTGIPQGSSTGEVIDLEDTPAFRETFFDSGSISPVLLDVEKDYVARNSRMNKRPSSSTDHPMFSNPSEIHAASGAWVSRNSETQILREETKPHFDMSNRNNLSMFRPKGHDQDDIGEKVPKYSYNQSFQEKGTRNFGGSLLSNAVNSTQPQGSPWTIEFLNRIKQKSRFLKQSVSYDLPPLSFSSSGNTPKVTKRKSTSILEFYKYEGGCTPQKIIAEKRQTGFSRPLNSLKTKKASASSPALTPVDKRARRTLSFSTNGSGGQSKLVWTDNNYHAIQKRL